MDLWVKCWYYTLCLILLRYGTVYKDGKNDYFKIHSQGKEDYDFEVLLNEGEDGIPQWWVGELYDAFACGEEYLWKDNDVECRFGSGKERRPSDEEIDNQEMSGFLADSDEDDVRIIIQDRDGWSRAGLAQ